MSNAALKPDSPWHAQYAAVGGHDRPFAELRAGAWARFAEGGFPDPREEEWRWTNVRPIARLDFEQATLAEVEALPAEDILRLLPVTVDGPRVALVDGLFHAGASTLLGLPEGVRIRPLSMVLAEDPDSIRDLLGAQADDRHSRFVALNTALMRDGVVIDVADNVRVEAPLTLLHAVGLTGARRGAQPRVLVRLGRHAELTLLEHLASVEGSQGFNNEVFEIELGENAKLSHVMLGEAASDGFAITAGWASLARDAHYRNLSYRLGGRLDRVDLNLSENGSGAHSDLIGLQMPRGRQHMDTHTRIHHAAAHTTSNEHYRSIADEHGRAVFKGRILVAEDAQKIEAYQSSANLILSDTAEIDAKPELEIYADDVKCSHGATIGQLDEDALYYLQSRGLPRDKARELLIFGFADEVINHLELPALRAHLTRKVAGNLATTLLEDR